MRKVVVTGIGAVTPLGNDFSASWENLLKGICGITHEGGIFAGRIKGFDSGAYLSDKELLRLDPFIHYAVASAHMATKDANVKPAGKTGVVIGSSRGGISSLSARLSGARASAYLMSSSTIGMAPSYVSAKLGLGGYCLGISNSCSSGANAIGEAYRLIKSGFLDTALAGGAEAPLCELALQGYGATGALSKSGIMRPFDKDRDGFLLGEGACVLYLEELSSALKRGARIYGEIAGYGNTVGAEHETRPKPDSQAQAIRDAISEAGLLPNGIGYISAHSTATKAGDSSEAEAISLVFGDSPPMVGADKSATGHMLSASGAFEAATALMSLASGTVPKVLNSARPEFDLNLAGGRLSSDAAISNSFGFGGVNAVLAFKVGL